MLRKKLMNQCFGHTSFYQNQAYTIFQKAVLSFKKNSVYFAGLVAVDQITQFAKILICSLMFLLYSWKRYFINSINKVFLSVIKFFVGLHMIVTPRKTQRNNHSDKTI